MRVLGGVLGLLLLVPFILGVEQELVCTPDPWDGPQTCWCYRAGQTLGASSGGRPERHAEGLCEKMGGKLAPLSSSDEEETAERLLQSMNLKPDELAWVEQGGTHWIDYDTDWGDEDPSRRQRREMLSGTERPKNLLYSLKGWHLVPDSELTRATAYVCALPHEKCSNNFSKGTVIGLAVGLTLSVIVVVVVSLIIYCCCCRRDDMGMVRSNSTVYIEHVSDGSGAYHTPNGRSNVLYNMDKALPFPNLTTTSIKHDQNIYMTPPTSTSPPIQPELSDSNLYVELSNDDIPTVFNAPISTKM